MRKLAVLIEVSISTVAEDKGSYHDFQKFHLLWIRRRAPVDSTVSHNLHSNQAKATKNTLPWFMITVLTGHLRSHGERIMALSELLACFSHAQGVLWQQRVTKYWDYIVTPRVPLLNHAGLLLWIGKLFLTLKWNKSPKMKQMSQKNGRLCAPASWVRNLQPNADFPDLCHWTVGSLQPAHVSHRR